MTSVYIGISIILCACDLHLYFLAIVCLYVINKFTRYHQTPLYDARTWGMGAGGGAGLVLTGRRGGGGVRNFRYRGFNDNST